MTARMWADKDILVAPRITMFREWSICFVYLYIYIYIVQDFFRMQGLKMAQEIGCRHVCKQNSSLLAYASPPKKKTTTARVHVHPHPSPKIATSQDFKGWSLAASLFEMCGSPTTFSASKRLFWSRQPSGLETCQKVAATNCMPISEANKKYSKVISTININDLFYIWIHY